MNRSMAIVPGLGEYLKMNEFLYRAWRRRVIVAWKSASVSEGKPTMKSPAIVTLGMICRARLRNSRYSPAV